MLFALLYAAVHLLLEILIVRCRSKARLEAEVRALRHQVGVLERQVDRPRWQPADRLLLAAIRHVIPRTDWHSLLPSPQTLLHWHRELVQRKWAAYRPRPRRQRPAQRSELHELILKLARHDERWGYRSIAGELLRLGHRCSHLTVREVLCRHNLPQTRSSVRKAWRSSGSPSGSPGANPFAERLRGTATRECPDHLLISGR